MTQLHDDLRGITTLLTTRGWCKFHNENGDGQLCLLGAINTVIFGESEFPLAGLGTDAQHRRFYDVISQLRDMLCVEWLAEWNDRQKDAAVVLKALDDALNYERKTNEA